MFEEIKSLFAFMATIYLFMRSSVATVKFGMN